VYLVAEIEASEIQALDTQVGASVRVRSLGKVL
jgi:hypothetical protein